MSVLIKTNKVCHRIIRDFFITINKYRTSHGVIPLEYEQELERSAQIAAKTVARIERVNIRETDPILCGENIGKINCGSHNLTGEELAAAWYAEGHGYNYKNENPNHFAIFSQLIWAASRYIGLAIEVNENNDAYFVGHFLPKGNIPGHYHLNVFPVKLHPPRFESVFEINVIANQRINFYRLKHNSQPLCLCLDLIKTAQTKADNMAYHHELPINQPFCNMWENSIIIFDPYKKLDYETIIDNWYDLGKRVDFSQECPGSDTEYFTQMIWKSTKCVGFGVSYHRGYHSFVIHFYPSGNVRNRFLENIEEGKKLDFHDVQSMSSLH